MSKKPMKKKGITEVPQVEVEKTPQDLSAEIKKMEDAMWDKYDGAIDTLRKRVLVMADQYDTATGVEQAAKALQAVNGKESMFDMALIGHDVAGILRVLGTSIHELKSFADGEDWGDKCKKLRGVCDNLYSHNVAESLETLFNDDSESEKTMYIATQLMLLDVCRFVGPACEDIADFVEAALDEIEKVVDAKNELEEQSE